MTPPKPACMTTDELATWTEQAAYYRHHWMRSATDDPCVDCTIPFALRMMAEGRCNGIPGLARKADRKPSSKVRLMARVYYFRTKLRDMGLDPAHAERVG